MPPHSRADVAILRSLAFQPLFSGDGQCQVKICVSVKTVVVVGHCFYRHGRIQFISCQTSRPGFTDGNVKSIVGTTNVHRDIVNEVLY